MKWRWVGRMNGRKERNRYGGELRKGWRLDGRGGIKGREVEIKDKVEEGLMKK